jgi:type I restriction enzyme S subunit
MYSTTAAGRSFLSGRASSASDGKFNINTQILKKVMLPLPSVEEQCQIVAMVNTVLQQEAATRCRQTALEALFRSLLHHLMTGTVRLNGVVPVTSEDAP